MCRLRLEIINVYTLILHLYADNSAFFGKSIGCNSMFSAFVSVFYVPLGIPQLNAVRSLYEF